MAGSAWAWQGLATARAEVAVTGRQPSSRTILPHHIAMPDDHHPLMPRRNREDVDLAAIKADLEFIIEQQSRARKEQALKPL